MKKYLFIVTVLALGITACSKIENQDIPEETPAGPAVYRVRMPATLGDQTRAVDFDGGGSATFSSFKTTDKVYVYNDTKHTWAYALSSHAYATLSPTTEGRQAELSGELDFWQLDETEGIFLPIHISPEVGDVLFLYYQPNYCYIDQPKLLSYDYAGQWGSAASASAHDFAEAAMRIKSIEGNASSGYTLTLCQMEDETQETAEFTNLGSMFRQRLTFKNADNETVVPHITSLSFKSKDNKLVKSYSAYSRTNLFTDVATDTPDIDADGDLYFALRFDGSTSTDALTLTATDEAGNYYECTKNAPAGSPGGFRNGKYYHGAMTLNWTKQLVIPTITGATNIEGPNSYGRLDLDDDVVEVTISGTSIGCYFKLWKYGTVTLDNLHATYSVKDSGYIDQNRSASDNEIVLTGTNSITNNAANAFWGLRYSGNLKFSCTGASATLTITTMDARYCGILAKNFPMNSSDYSVLAKTGYSISRTGGSNGDGTYTWTYTVTKEE